MKKITTVASACLLSLSAFSAQAESISHNAAFVSDYVWRGLTATDNSPALQAGSDYKNGNAYAGVWLSNVEDQSGEEGVPVEMDVYFGYNNQFDGFNLDLSVTTYNYLNDTDRDLTEFRVATSPKSIEGLEIALNREVKAQFWYPEVTFEKFLPHRLYLDLSAGFWSVDDGDNAITMRAELARDFPEFHHVDIFGAITYLSDETVMVDDGQEDAETVFLMGVRKRF
jgi:uncharacterized protein (TIGR02001 family)